MEGTPQDKLVEKEEVRNPDRRKLLKLLAAGGAVTAASMLPGKWSSPVIKTGVLPAHAQVTPGRFEVQCDPQWGSEPGEVSIFFYVSATAVDTVANAPLAGVSLTATIPTTGGSATDVQSTSAQGVASFQIEVLLSELPQSITATITFTDQGTYGTASCSIPIVLPT